MRKFKVTLQGNNLLLKLDSVAKYGVLVVRYVEALDEVIAGHTAMENFRCEQKAKELNYRLLNLDSDPATYEIGEVVELDSFDRIDNLNPGFIFYPETKSDLPN